MSEDKISDIEGTKVEKCGKSEIKKIESGADIGQAMQTRGQKLQEGKQFSTLKEMDSINVNKRSSEMSS